MSPTVIPGRNGISEKGLGKEVAARVLDHSDVVVAALPGDKLVVSIRLCPLPSLPLHPQQFRGVVVGDLAVAGLGDSAVRPRLVQVVHDLDFLVHVADVGAEE